MNKYKIVLDNRDDLYIHADRYVVYDDITEFLIVNKDDSEKVMTINNDHLIYIELVENVDFDANDFLIGVYKAKVRLALMNCTTDKVSIDAIDIVVDNRTRGLTSDDVVAAFNLVELLT